MSVLTKFLAASLFLGYACSSSGAEAARESAGNKQILIAASTIPFSAGTLNRQENIPASYGPFKARSAGIGVYRGRMNVAPTDLNEHIFVVIRTQSDKNHRFGWIRAFVNNKLIATEASIRDNRIIQDVTKELKAGDVQLAVMGTAMPDTYVDFYVVPKDSVLKVVQSRPAGEMMAFGGPFSTKGGKQENFSANFTLYKAAVVGKPVLTYRTNVLPIGDKPDSKQRFTWIRVLLNGVPIGSEQNLNGNEASLDISDKMLDGLNKVEISGVATTDATMDWYLSQLPLLEKPSTLASASSTNSRAPKISKLSPSNEINAGQILQIQGENIDQQTGNNKILFNNLSAPAKSIKNDWVTVEIPKDIQSGTYNVSVTSNNVRSNTLTIQVKGDPHIRNLSASECPPESELEIKGDNFPEQINQVKVTVGNAVARVLQTSKQRILIKVPDLPFDTVHPIKVVAGQQSSSEDFSIKIGNSTTPGGSAQESNQ